MLDPCDVVVPLLGIDRNGIIQRFLGTGSFVGEQAVLLTADHVIRDWSDGLAIVTMHDVPASFRTISGTPDTVATPLEILYCSRAV